jgi:hypothetical protein
VVGKPLPRLLIREPARTILEYTQLLHHFTVLFSPLVSVSRMSCGSSVCALRLQLACPVCMPKLKLTAMQRGPT